MVFSLLIPSPDPPRRSGFAYAECDCPEQLGVRNSTVVELTISSDGISSLSPVQVVFEAPRAPATCRSQTQRTD